MTEQWQELKETITQMRDNNGTGTQKEVCKFLVDLMNILEKQMQESSGDAISREDRLVDLANAIESDDSGYWTNKRISSALRNINNLPSVNPQESKTGHWIEDNQRDLRICSICGRALPLIPRKDYYCPNCGAKMIDSQKVRKKYVSSCGYTYEYI